MSGVPGALPPGLRCPGVAGFAKRPCPRASSGRAARQRPSVSPAPAGLTPGGSGVKLCLPPRTREGLAPRESPRSGRVPVLRL